MKKITTFWNKHKAALGRFGWLVAVPYMFLLAFFFSEVLKPANQTETFPSQLVFPLCMHLVTAVIIAAIVMRSKWVKSLAGKVFASGFIGLLMVNFKDRLGNVTGLYRALIPFLPHPDSDLGIISILFLITIIVIAMLLGRLLETLQSKRKFSTNDNIAKGITAVAVVVVTIQSFGLLRFVTQVYKESQYQPPVLATTPVKTPLGKPDVYYIVLDRYTNSSVLKSQFNYDNSQFLGGLKDLGYKVNDQALSQYPYTTMSVSSTFNASYHQDDLVNFTAYKNQSATLFHNMIHRSSVAKFFLNQGYKYYSIGSDYGASNNAPLATVDYADKNALTIMGKKRHLRDLEATQFEQSPYVTIAERAPSRLLGYSTKSEVDYARSQLQQLQNLVDAKEQGGRLIFTHILVPHDPFYFNADGSISSTPFSDNNGKNIKQKYVGQVEFINTQIAPLLSQISANSKGEAVVLLVSDEGPYPFILNQTFMKPLGGDYGEETIYNGDMTQWPRADLDMKYGILQAVHIPAATAQDEAAYAPVNMFRVVLNRYFGQDMPYLPACQLALPKGRNGLYIYKDISAQFDKQNDACKQYQSGM